MDGGRRLAGSLRNTGQLMHQLRAAALDWAGGNGTQSSGWPGNHFGGAGRGGLAGWLVGETIGRQGDNFLVPLLLLLL